MLSVSMSPERPRRRLVLGALLPVTLVALACTKPPADVSVVQASDLVAGGASFDAGEIVPLASFTDTSTLTRADVLAFLEKTPYGGGASFLASYSSNGILAVDAILASAQNYSLNPLVFLVRAEMQQGLVGEPVYPATPSRVEYVFGCGCARGASACEAALAGFDVQVDCLGRQLRASLDAVAATGHTPSGWAPGAGATTLDGVRVTPADPSTAALYDYTPYVDEGKAGGNWLFWNLWRKYAAALGYTAPAADGGATTATLGSPCTSSGNCSYATGVCATNYPGGLCTAPCTATCPADSSSTPAFCADFGTQGGFCLAVCNPNASACRSGYTCESVVQFGDATKSAYVCAPASP